MLGSTSPRRRELVQLLGLRIPVRFEASDADESIPPGLAPAEAAQRLALNKAAGVRDRLGAEAAGTVIVGADTIVVLDGDILGKPRDAAEARRMLGMLQGRSHEVITGVAVLDGTSGESKTAAGITRVVMKPLDADRIARYVATGEPLDKAGAYGIQGLAAGFVERIEGCYFNVVGLPLSLLGDLLAEFGVETI